MELTIIKLEFTNISFKIAHNLGERGTEIIQVLATAWIKQTDDYTAQLFCEYFYDSQGCAPHLVVCLPLEDVEKTSAFRDTPIEEASEKQLTLWDTILQNRYNYLLHYEDPLLEAITALISTRMENEIIRRAEESQKGDATSIRSVNQTQTAYA